MKRKLKLIINEINKGLIEREAHIKLAVLAIFANENIIFIGPPGTAKSEISRRLSKVVDNGTYFEYLLTKFTSPEEIFGPISIKELENDNFKRNTEGYMPNSNIVFLDEIFKANSSILNSLLTILNERIYHNGSSAEKTNIFSVISASNEVPVNQMELKALYDRFLIKKEVSYVKDTKKLMDTILEPLNLEKKIKKEEILKSLNKSRDIIISESLKENILNIKNKIENKFEEEIISDRKLLKSIKILKVAACIEERKEISIYDMLLLQNIFWENPKNLKEIKEIIKKEIVGEKDRDNSEIIFSKWRKHFDSLFSEQKKDEEGFLLYVSGDGSLTREEKGEVHLCDNIGEYIYYKGYRDHIKILAELGNFDDAYVNTGFKTLDNKIVWKHDFSPTELVSSPHKNMDSYEKLMSIEKLPKAMINNYREYKNHYKKNKDNLSSILKDIKRNVLSEAEIVRNFYLEVKQKQKSLEEYEKYSIWLDEEDISEIKNIISKGVEGNYKILDDYELLLSELDEAMI